MNALVGLAVIAVAGFGLVGLVWWIERATGRPGLSAFVGGLLALIGAVASLSVGQRLLPAIFVLQAVLFFYMAHERRSAAREAKRDGA